MLPNHGFSLILCFYSPTDTAAQSLEDLCLWLLSSQEVCFSGADPRLLCLGFHKNEVVDILGF